MSAAKKWQAAAYFILSGGFLASAIATWKDSQATAMPTPTNGLGKLGQRAVRSPASRKALPPGQVGAPVGKLHDVKNIDERVALLKKLIKKGSLNNELRERTVELLSQKCDSAGRVLPAGASGPGLKWCVPEKDCWAEVCWLFNSVRRPGSKYAVRYTRDMILADTFTAAERTLLKTHGGDCDDYVVLLGSMLMAIGHPIKIRVIQTKDKASWSHVYLITPEEFDDPKARWRAVDCSVDKPCGWEAPGAEEVAKTGRPAGITAKVKDYPMPTEEG